MWMAGVYYVDTAIPGGKKKRKENKIHTVFDGNRVFRIGKLTELGDAGEIYVDTLFPEIYDALEWLRRGVRVYLLENTIKLKKLRVENNMRKSDVILLVRILREV